MKNLVLSALLSSVIACSANAALKEGDVAPAFKTQASLTGKEFSFSLKEALKKGPVIVQVGGSEVEIQSTARDLELSDQPGLRR